MEFEFFLMGQAFESLTGAITWFAYALAIVPAALIATYSVGLVITDRPKALTATPHSTAELEAAARDLEANPDPYAERFKALDALRPEDR